MFWFFCCEACGILATWPGNEPASSALEGKVLTTELPGKFKDLKFFHNYFTGEISGLAKKNLTHIVKLISSVQLFSRVWLFATPWTAACQASLSITNSWSSLKLMSVESVMPSNHLTLCRPLLLLPSIFPSIRLFQWVSSSHQVAKVLGVSASASVLPMNIQDWFPLGWTGWISLQSKGLSRVFSNTTAQKHQFFGAQPFYNPTLTSIHDYWKNHSLD